MARGRYGRPMRTISRRPPRTGSRGRSRIPARKFSSRKRHMGSGRRVVNPGGGRGSSYRGRSRQFQRSGPGYRRSTLRGSSVNVNNRRSIINSPRTPDGWIRNGLFQESDKIATSKAYNNMYSSGKGWNAYGYTDITGRQHTGYCAGGNCIDNPCADGSC